MKVAVIGANGQLGSDLVRVFGSDVISLTHNDVDVTNPLSLEILKKLKPDIIINTAGFVRVDDAEIDPLAAFKTNALGALNVAKLSEELGSVIVYVSTDYVFDGRKTSPYTERDRPNPINVYGLSKYAGEVFTKNYSSKHYVIRVASLYGKKGSKAKKGNFVSKIVEKARKGEVIKVVDDIVMSPTYTLDVAMMLKRLLLEMPAFGTYHVVNEGFCSWYEFARTILDILEMNAELVPIKSDEISLPAKRPKFSALKNEKLESLGLSMRPWREALTDFLRNSFQKRNY